MRIRSKTTAISATTKITTTMSTTQAKLLLRLENVFNLMLVGQNKFRTVNPTNWN